MNPDPFPPVRGLNTKELFILYCEAEKHGKPKDWMEKAVKERIGWPIEKVNE